MSGRIYDYTPGIPICKVCGSIMLRSCETNFNGCYCEECGNSEYNYIVYDINHPIWVKYDKFCETKQDKLISLEEMSFENFLKKI